MNYTTFKISAFLFTSFLIACYGCVTLSNPSKKVISESAMEEGMAITIQADWATIEIAAVGKNKRDYTWDGQTVSVNFIPRQKRWNGSLGLLDDNQVRPPHKGVVHMVVEEGQQHFQTIDDAMLWLKSFSEKPIYRDDGLVVLARITGSNSNKMFVSIYVMQIYIEGVTLSEYQETFIDPKYLETVKKYSRGDQFETWKRIHLRKHYTGGHKPEKIPGSQNSRITIKYNKATSNEGIQVDAAEPRR